MPRNAGNHAGQQTMQARRASESESVSHHTFALWERAGRAGGASIARTRRLGAKFAHTSPSNACTVSVRPVRLAVRPVTRRGAAAPMAAPLGACTL